MKGDGEESCFVRLRFDLFCDVQEDRDIFFGYCFIVWEDFDAVLFFY